MNISQRWAGISQWTAFALYGIHKRPKEPYLTDHTLGGAAYVCHQRDMLSDALFDGSHDLRIVSKAFSAFCIAFLAVKDEWRRQCHDLVKIFSRS